jgi:hypothetical protein
MARPFYRFLPLLVFLVAACATTPKNAVNSRLAGEMPPRIVWAWERPEDLRFLDADRFGVAFLAQTLILENDEVVFRPRRQPLEVADGAFIIAVTRIETVKDSSKRPSLSANQRNRIVELIVKSLDRPNVRAVQTDFDVVVSERSFYRDLIGELRAKLPARFPLTMTSLASWCVGDVWFNDFPVDEAVPMAFEMGADSSNIRDYLAKGNDWREPLCRGSYGISVDDPIERRSLREGRRIYFFKNSSWKPADLNSLGGP